jgi:glycogen debranching enzyme
MVNPDGSQVKGPKALCELQGYVYDARIRVAEIYDFIGNAERARILKEKAEALFYLFNDVFWDQARASSPILLMGPKGRS